MTLGHRVRPYIPFLAMIAFMLLLTMDPALANIFTKPTQKLQELKTGLLLMAKVSVAIAFVGCFLAALAGRINWRWVAVVAGVSVALATLDTILTFLDLN